MVITRRSWEISIMFAVSFILNVLIFFVDESRYSFDFFSKPAELRLLGIFTIAFCSVPLAIYGLVGDRNQQKSFRWALVGFLPPLIVISWLVLA